MRSATITRNLGIVAVLVLMFALMGCDRAEITSSDEIVAKDYCEIDADCICDGQDPDGGCFLGNKEYYKKYVDKSEDCPNFCTGVAGNMVVRCIDNKCVQMFECLTDAECSDGSCVENKCS